MKCHLDEAGFLNPSPKERPKIIPRKTATSPDDGAIAPQQKPPTGDRSLNVLLSHVPEYTARHHQIGRAGTFVQIAYSRVSLNNIQTDRS
jgi:hypothetical protein